MLNRSSLAFALALSVLASSPLALFAQQQPPQAINQQDEVINLQLNRDQGADDVLEILRSGDKFETNKYVTKAIELKNTAAYEMRLIVSQAIQLEKGTLRAVSTVPTDGAKSRQFLVVTTTREQMPSIIETIQTLDVNGYVNSQGRGRQAMRTKYRKASELLTILQGTCGTSGTRLFADDVTNTIYYDDSPFVIEQIAPYVEFYDVPTPQVEFDIQILEIREDDVKKVGLDWDAWKRSIGGQFSVTATQFENRDNFVRLDSLLTLDANVLANFLNYTVQTGNAKLLQRSRMNASNLEPAVISDVKRVPYYDYIRSERNASVLVESNPNVDTYEKYDEDEPRSFGFPRVLAITPPVTNVLKDLSSEEEGLLIVIQPNITTESVSAEISIALNTVTGLDQQNRPILTEQNLANRFTLQNKNQLLLGTLERETEVDSRRGIPGLKDLPVLKYVFGVESSQKSRSRVFILATPTFSNVSFNAIAIL